jgi:hypothetical protein
MKVYFFVYINLSKSIFSKFSYGQTTPPAWEYIYSDPKDRSLLTKNQLKIIFSKENTKEIFDLFKNNSKYGNYVKYVYPYYQTIPYEESQASTTEANIFFPAYEVITSTDNLEIPQDYFDFIILNTDYSTLSQQTIDLKNPLYHILRIDKHNKITITPEHVTHLIKQKNLYKVIKSEQIPLINAINNQQLIPNQELFEIMVHETFIHSSEDQKKKCIQEALTYKIHNKNSKSFITDEIIDYMFGAIHSTLIETQDFGVDLLSLLFTSKTKINKSKLVELIKNYTPYEHQDEYFVPPLFSFLENTTYLQPLTEKELKPLLVDLRHTAVLCIIYQTYELLDQLKKYDDEIVTKASKTLVKYKPNFNKFSKAIEWAETFLKTNKTFYDLQETLKNKTKADNPHITHKNKI